MLVLRRLAIHYTIFVNSDSCTFFFFLLLQFLTQFLRYIDFVLLFECSCLNTFKRYMYETQRRLLHAMHYHSVVLIYLMVILCVDCHCENVHHILLREMGAPSCIYLQDQF